MAIKRAIKAGNKSIISFKKVIKVGEITQLVSKDNIPATKIQQGVTFTNNGDGSVTANGASTNQYYSEIDIRIGDVYQWQEDDHKYLLLSGMNSNDNGAIECILWVGFIDGQPGQAYNAADLSSRFDFNFTIPKGQYVIKSVKCRIRSGYTAENVTFTPQLFDLTEMFGAGHEPATVAEFKEKFPEAYYPYQRAVLTVYNKVVRPCARKGEVIQLVSAGDFNESRSDFYGVTYTNNEDGSWTLNGTCTTSANYDVLYNANSSKLPIIKDHVYLALDNRTGKINNAGNSTVQILNAQQTFIIGTSDNQEIGYQFRTSSITTMCYVRIRIEQGVTYNNVKLIPQLFDLTAMYGAGNEPKTLADFRKDFPDSYYPYSPIQTKNLFNWSGKLRQNYDTGNCTIVKILTNGAILQGNVGDATGSASYSNGWFRPGAPYGYGTQISLSANDVVTISADYEIIERNYASPTTIGVYLYGTEQLTRPYVSQIETGVLYRVKETYAITKDGQYYPVFTLNSSKVKITNIQLEKGSVATDYVPHDYI